MLSWRTFSSSGRRCSGVPRDSARSSSAGAGGGLGQGARGLAQHALVQDVEGLQLHGMCLRVEGEAECFAVRTTQRSRVPADAFSWAAFMAARRRRLAPRERRAGAGAWGSGGGVPGSFAGASRGLKISSRRSSVVLSPALGAGCSSAEMSSAVVGRGCPKRSGSETKEIDSSKGCVLVLFEWYNGKSHYDLVSTRWLGRWERALCAGTMLDSASPSGHGK